jgi:MFS family permease
VLPFDKEEYKRSDLISFIYILYIKTNCKSIEKCKSNKNRILIDTILLDRKENIHILYYMKLKKMESRTRRTVRISLIDGAFAQIYTSLSGIGSIFVTKFLVLLNAGPIHFGMLSALGQLSQVFQLLGSVIAKESDSRKKMVLIMAFLGRSLSFLFGFVSIVFFGKSTVIAFLVLFFVSNALQAMSANLWVAWISDMVPMGIRGRFFSMRSQLLLLVGLLTGYLFSFVIDLFDEAPGGFSSMVLDILNKPSFFNHENLNIAFIFIFSFAALMGIIGIYILSFQPEKKKNVDKDEILKMYFEPFKDKNFIRFLIYGLWWMTAVGIGAPFWQPFMIKTLKMSMVEIQIYGTISTFASLIALKPWGKFIDKFGNKTAMRIAILMGGINPLIWLFANQNSYRIIFVEAFLSGIMWAGAGIVATNFVLSIAPENKRGVYSGIYGALTGIAMMFSMILSSIVVPKPLQIFGLSLSGEQVLFGLTGIARWTTEIPITFIKEPRSKRFKEALFFFQEFAKVRIIQITQWFIKRK